MYLLFHVFESLDIFYAHLLKSHTYDFVNFFEPGSSPLKVITTFLLSHAVDKLREFCLFHNDTL